MNQSDSMLASDIAAKMAVDRHWLVYQDDPGEVIDEIIIDGQIPVLDISIYLRDIKRYDLAVRLLRRVREHFPGHHFPIYHSALNHAGLLDRAHALSFAREAVEMAPSILDYRLFLIRVLTISAEYAAARDVLNATTPQNVHEFDKLNEHAQFIELCETYPFESVKYALKRLEACGRYSQFEQASTYILEAIEVGEPFSMIRLGDGEGAWLSISAHDEGRYSSLYRSNRVSFLEDWFGHGGLITDDPFYVFARSLQIEFSQHSLIGIPPMARLDHEEGLISLRGITTAVNIFRHLGLLEHSRPGAQFCSNSINLSLQYDTDFYRQLFQKDVRFGLITSQVGLANKMVDAGLRIEKSYVIPGDSRNFHLDKKGRVECQFPDYVARINSDLAQSDLRGIVFFVGGGFVGKRYLNTIRSRGGIAFDLGSLADHWMKGDLPI